MTWAHRRRSTRARRPKTAKLHTRKKMKVPRAVLADPWKHIGQARGQK